MAHGDETRTYDGCGDAVSSSDGDHPTLDDFKIPSEEELLVIITQFCQRHGIADTDFGMRALRDPNLVRELRQGRRRLLVRTVRKLLEFMRLSEEGAVCLSGSRTSREVA